MVLAKERVSKAARIVICNSEDVTKLIDELVLLQAEIVEKRSVLRFISRQGCNGELARAVAGQIESVLLQDLDGLNPTDTSRAWSAAFEELQSNSDAALPEIAGAA